MFFSGNRLSCCYRWLQIQIYLFTFLKKLFSHTNITFVLNLLNDFVISVFLLYKSDSGHCITRSVFSSVLVQLTLFMYKIVFYVFIIYIHVNYCMQILMNGQISTLESWTFKFISNLDVLGFPVISQACFLFACWTHSIHRWGLV